MKELFKYFNLAFMVLFFLTSCAKDEFDIYSLGDNNLIKSEWSNNKIISNYKYNAIGKIEEEEGIYFYNRYFYDKDGKLIKIETAADPSWASSSHFIEKTELMTAKNSTISWCRIFKYDKYDKLFEIENYFKKEIEFSFTSKNSFEFADENIVKVNLHDKNGEITQFRVYQYDNNGNVINYKYYSYLLVEDTQPELISETSYKFDHKKNPFKIFDELGNPGLYTNSNKIIETNSTLYEKVPGIDKYSTSKTTYEYNGHNYPVKVITDNSEYEYKY